MKNNSPPQKRLQIFCFNQCDQGLVIGAVILIGDGGHIIHRRPGFLSKPGVPDGGDGVAELAVDAAAVIELLVGWPGRALVLDAADAANAHDEDDEHQDEGDAEGPDDDVEGVPGHVGEALRHVT